MIEGRATSRRSVTAVFHHDRVVVTVGGDGAGDDNGVPMMPIMMPAAMVVERNRSVVTVMEPLAFLVDDPDVVVMSMMGRDDNVSLGGRSQSGQSH